MVSRQNQPAPDSDSSRVRALLDGDARRLELPQGSPRLLMLAGLPGSGKSTFARQIVDRLSFLWVETDRLRKTLVAQPVYTPEEHQRVFRVCHQMLGEFLEEGYPVLLDATNLARRNREPVLAIARRLKVPVAIAVLSAPRDVIRQRLEHREAGMDPGTWSDAGFEIYSRMAPAWEPVQGPHIHVDTSQDTAAALQQVLAWADC